MPPDDLFTRNLARAFLAGSWTLAGLLRRGAQACGRRERWLRLLARRVLAAFAEPRGELDEEALASYLDADAAASHFSDTPRRLFWLTPNMRPHPRLAGLSGLPVLTSPAGVAEWLGLPLRQLDWFAGCPGRTRKLPDGPLHHYVYH